MHFECRGKTVRFVALFLLATLTGCATPSNKLYSGEPLPRDKIALLVSAPVTSPFNPHPLIRQIDGTNIERSKWDGKAQVDLLPGNHAVSIGFVQSTFGGVRFSKSNYLIKFNAEAGHTYEAKVAVSTDGGDDRWDAEIVDLATKVSFRPN
jgi:hypothetical protein